MLGPGLVMFEAFDPQDYGEVAPYNSRKSARNPSCSKCTSFVRAAVMPSLRMGLHGNAIGRAVALVHASSVELKAGGEKKRSFEEQP